MHGDGHNPIVISTRSQDSVLRYQLKTLEERHPVLRGTPSVALQEAHFNKGERFLVEIATQYGKERQAALTTEFLADVTLYLQQNPYSINDSIGKIMFTYGIESVVETIKEMLGV
jgi:hypothetical protein